MKRKEQENSVEKNPKKIKKSARYSNLDNGVTKNTDSKIISNNKQNGENDRKKQKRIKFEKSLPTKLPKVHKKNVQQKSNSNNLKKKLIDTSTIEKEDWQKFKKKKKDLKEKRKERKLTDLYDIAIKAKKISEKLRRSDCTKEERQNLTKELHQLLKSHYNKVIFTHDMSRTIQWIIKFCQHDIRYAIFDELKLSLLDMTKSKYAKNCVRSLLKYGNAALRKNIISMWYGNIVNLMSHNISAPLIELAYSTWASDEDKINFKQEFYGHMYKITKDKEVKVLSDSYKNAEDMKSGILSAVKTNITRILNKKLINSTLLQTIIWEFLSNCSLVDRNEIICMLKNFIVELSNTKIGTKVAMICIWHASNKDRKFIMKAFKGNVKNIAMSEHGHMVLLALMDSVDDTVLIKKIILSEILKDLTEILLNVHGKNVILYLVARRDSHYFPPSVIECLNPGDNNEVSKKPSHVREKELLEAVIDTFLKSIATETAVWLSKGSISMVALAVLKVGSGEQLHCAFRAIATFLINTENKIVEEDVEYNLIEHSGLHLMLKKLIQHDKKLEKEETIFGEILIDHITNDVLKQWIKFNRGCFLFILLIENEPKAIVNKLLLKLQGVLKSIKKQQTPGALILLKKLEEIQ